MSKKSKATTQKADGKEASTPKLRFPEFRDAPEWECVSLKDAAVPVVERVGQRKLTTVSISAGIGFVPQAEKFGRDISGSQYQLYTLVRDGDFVYNKGNSLKFPQGCVYLLSGWGQVAAPNVFICFRLTEGYSNLFFQYCFEQNFHGKQLKRHISSGARSNGLLNISKEHFFGVEVPTPSLPEQQKIAECMSSVDALLAAQARKLDALKTHKQGLMQELFPREGENQPRLRFPDFLNAGEWREQRLEDLAKRGSGHTPSKSNAEYYNGGIMWVSLADSKRLDRGLISETAILVSERGIKNSSAVLHPKDTVLISRDAGVGKSAIMSRPMAVSQHFIVWTCHPHLLSNWFLYHLLQRSKSQFERAATGSTIMTIGLQYFIDLKFRIPSLPEQIRIAECLTAVDTVIALQNEQVEALKIHKRGLMQQLFSSREEAEA
jgi:type I restriction enzyme S subunit